MIAIGSPRIILFICKSFSFTIFSKSLTLRLKSLISFNNSEFYLFFFINSTFFCCSPFLLESTASLRQTSKCSRILFNSPKGLSLPSPNDDWGRFNDLLSSLTVFNKFINCFRIYWMGYFVMFITLSLNYKYNFSTFFTLFSKKVFLYLAF